MLKSVLQWSISFVFVIHLLMLALNRIPNSVGYWGLLMQLIYYQYLRNFPFVNHKSMLFVLTLCKAKNSKSRFLQNPMSIYYKLKF
jgi:hypothetical protein